MKKYIKKTVSILLAISLLCMVLSINAENEEPNNAFYYPIPYVLEYEPDTEGMY